MAVVVGAEHDDGTAHPGRPQLQPLLDQGDGERAAQRLQGARDRHRAVAVGVGLDHAQHRDRRPHRLPEAGEVALHGPEVDLGDRGTDGGANVHFSERDAHRLYRSRDSGLAGQTLEIFLCAKRSVNLHPIERSTSGPGAGPAPVAGPAQA